MPLSTFLFKVIQEKSLELKVSLSTEAGQKPQLRHRWLAEMRAACVLICKFHSSVEFAAKFLKLLSVCG